MTGQGKIYTQTNVNQHIFFGKAFDYNTILKSAYMAKIILNAIYFTALIGSILLCLVIENAGRGKQVVD